MAILFRPEAGVAADFIPFYWEGKYHLFYLLARDPAHGEGIPWVHLVTEDFVNFEDWGVAIPAGGVEDQDLHIFTGSVLAHEGGFTIYYTGDNGHFREQDRPAEIIMRATSPDLRTWTKDPDFGLAAPAEMGYEPHDWRDPFVFWNAEAGEYWMLLAARRTVGPERQRGCVALMTSPDQQIWSLRAPFWDPGQYITHECPDLFRQGNWWYLVYSTYSERQVTHYRMARSLAGPWQCPADDVFDARPYYAAKTAGDGDRRYVFGWLATRAEDSDEGAWGWGGDLVVHEAVARPDGTFAVRMPETVAAAFTTTHGLTPQPVWGGWQTDSEACVADATARHSIFSLGELPEECLVEATVTFEAATAACGLQLRMDPAANRYYQLRLEPSRQRVVMDRWPRPADQPFMLERPLALTAGEPVRLRVLVSGTCVVVYVNDEIALSSRMYNHRDGHLGLFVTEGQARFENVTIKTR